MLESKAAVAVKTNNDIATIAIKDDIEDVSQEDEVFTFTADGKVTAVDSEDSYLGTYSLKGDKLTMDIYGVKATTKVTISGNTFASDIDETQSYQEDIIYLVPNEKNVVVSKVTTRYTYKRK